MIIGIGVDVLKISRVTLEIAKRVLSEEEMNTFNQFKLEKRKLEFLAGRFSLKEAMMKALSNTEYVIGMRDITILNDQNGKPYVKKPIYQAYRFLISISHEKDYSVGFCVIESV